MTGVYEAINQVEKCMEWDRIPLPDTVPEPRIALDQRN
jgi:hypothetical protein